MSSGSITIRDMTEETGHLDKSKSDMTSKIWFITTVYHKRIRKLTPEGYEYAEDYEPFKEYCNDKVAEFFEERLLECFQTEHYDLLDAGLEFNFDVSVEITGRGMLHHHTIVEAKYPRIVDESDPKHRLKDWVLNYTSVNKIFREVIFPNKEIPVKVQITNTGTNSIENLKNYILKKQ